MDGVILPLKIHLCFFGTFPTEHGALRWWWYLKNDNGVRFKEPNLVKSLFSYEISCVLKLFISYLKHHAKLRSGTYCLKKLFASVIDWYWNLDPQVLTGCVHAQLKLECQRHSESCPYSYVSLLQPIWDFCVLLFRNVQKLQQLWIIDWSWALGSSNWSVKQFHYLSITCKLIGLSVRIISSLVNFPVLEILRFFCLGCQIRNTFFIFYRNMKVGFSVAILKVCNFLISESRQVLSFILLIVCNMFI